MPRTRTGFAAILCVATSITCQLDEPAAHAQEPQGDDVVSAPLEACLDSYEQAQRHRKGGELMQAREALMICSRDVCPDIAKADCTRWLAEVRQDVPSIVLGASFEEGGDAIQVRVTIDGKPLANQLDGRALEVNPGIHVLRFETAGREPVQQRVSIRVGERNRRIMAVFPALPPPPPPPEPPGVPTISYVLGGVGVIGLAGFGYFAATGRSDESDLERCKPVCAADDVDDVRKRYLAADVSLAVGVLALGGASYFYFTRSTDLSEHQDRGTVGLRLQTAPGRVSASLGGQF